MFLIGTTENLSLLFVVVFKEINTHYIGSSGKEIQFKTPAFGVGVMMHLQTINTKRKESQTILTGVFQCDNNQFI